MVRSARAWLPASYIQAWPWLTTWHWRRLLKAMSWRIWSVLCWAEDFELPAYHGRSGHWPVSVHFYTMPLVAGGDETWVGETGQKLVYLVIHDDMQKLLFWFWSQRMISKDKCVFLLWAPRVVESHHLAHGNRLWAAASAWTTALLVQELGLI